MPDKTVQSDAGLTYTAAQVAERLGIGHAMLRRYAAAYEKLTATELTIDRRDGRLFSQEQLDVLQATREKVQRSGTPVNAAMEAVLRNAQMPVELRERSLLPGDTQELIEALTEAYSRANEPLLAELKNLRIELEAQRQPGKEMMVRELEQPAVSNGDKPPSRAGLFAGLLRRWRRVRAALVDKEDT